MFTCGKTNFDEGNTLYDPSVFPGVSIALDTIKSYPFNAPTNGLLFPAIGFVDFDFDSVRRQAWTT